MSADDKVVGILRMQAWERAKGELQAMLATYYPIYKVGRPSNISHGPEVTELIDKFISEVEDNGLQEAD